MDKNKEKRLKRKLWWSNFGKGALNFFSPVLETVADFAGSAVNPMLGKLARKGVNTLLKIPKAGIAQYQEKQIALANGQTWGKKEAAKKFGNRLLKSIVNGDEEGEEEQEQEQEQGEAVPYTPALPAGGVTITEVDDNGQPLSSMIETIKP
jgi:hypothetical protein